MKSETVVSLEAVRKEIGKRFPVDSKVVLCHGVFDLLHPGHIEHLREAKSFGDVLVVSVTSDRFVNKGPGRPYFSEKDRALMLSSLELVDLVTISDFKDALAVLEQVKPNVYAKGPDYNDVSSDITGKIVEERSLCEANGGSMVFTSGPTMSSSSLRNEMIIGESDDFGKWLPTFRASVSEANIEGLFSSLRGLKVLVVGEAIIDEYVMCEALGKSSKDPVLAFKIGTRELQLGGAFAVANHAAGLGAQVTLVTRVGNETEVSTLIQKDMDPTVSVKLLKSNTDPSIVKTRYVDELTKSKVFETYQIGEMVASETDDNALAGALEPLLDSVDVILVADYGHGLISQRHLELLAKTRALKAVNTQSNAGNRGFNSISRYGAIDIVCLNGSEVGLELKQRHVPLGELVGELAIRTSAKFVAVTHGAKGVVYLDSRGAEPTAQDVPAFSTRVTDRVGAGDALFVAASLSWAAGNSGLISAVVGNLAGAASLAGLGNKVTLDSISLQKHMSALLK
jgi:rfaE bifunctional protein nucleotidyltransferase chain/domain